MGGSDKYQFCIRSLAEPLTKEKDGWIVTGKKSLHTCSFVFHLVILRKCAHEFKEAQSDILWTIYDYLWKKKYSFEKIIRDEWNYML